MLRACPPRSYVVWLDGTPHMLNSVTLSYSDSTIRDKVHHMLIARSDHGCWLPSSLSDHKVYPTVRHIIASRAYLNRTVVVDGSLADVPDVLGALPADCGGERAQ